MSDSISDAEYQTYVWQGSNDLALKKWPINQQIKQMSLGLYHSAFLSNEGRVYCCGINSHGQLGLGDNEATHMEPVEVPFPAGMF